MQLKCYLFKLLNIVDHLMQIFLSKFNNNIFLEYAMKCSLVMLGFIYRFIKCIANKDVWNFLLCVKYMLWLSSNTTLLHLGKL